MSHEVIVIGAGLSGLSAAIQLQQRGVDVKVIEASDAPGGRVRTDVVDGFRLDRGFQVLLEAYPECRKALNYAELDLRGFHSGAQIWADGHLCTVADPMRQPFALIDTLNAPIGSFMDKLRILSLRRRALRGNVRDLFTGGEESTTLEALTELGFSRQMIDRFFRPWLGGIFLGRDLSTSSRMFDFVMRMMIQGRTSIPAQGIGAIPEQLAAKLKPGTIEYGRAARSASDGVVTLADGEQLSAETVIVATEAPAAARLLDRPEINPGGRSVSCLYFAASGAPVDGPWLVLDGDTSGPVNNLCVPTQLSPALAPKGKQLISATVLNSERRKPAELVQSVRRQLRRWFGSPVDQWRHLTTYQIEHAQPQQLEGFFSDRGVPLRISDRLIVCGDHRETASLNGALRSGRHAARMVLSRRGQAVTA